MTLSCCTTHVGGRGTHRGEGASCVSSVPTRSRSWSCTAAASICTASRLERHSASGGEAGARAHGGVRAWNGVLTGVFSRVSDEGGGDGEGHAAQVALVRFLPGVAPFVVGERAGLSEGLTAHVADVRLLPAVQPAWWRGVVGGVKHRGRGRGLYLMCIL